MTRDEYLATSLPIPQLVLAHGSGWVRRHRELLRGTAEATRLARGFRYRSRGWPVCPLAGLALDSGWLLGAGFRWPVDGPALAEAAHAELPWRALSYGHGRCLDREVRERGMLEVRELPTGEVAVVALRGLPEPTTTGAVVWAGPASGREYAQRLLGGPLASRLRPRAPTLAGTFVAQAEPPAFVWRRGSITFVVSCDLEGQPCPAVEVDAPAGDLALGVSLGVIGGAPAQLRRADAAVVPTLRDLGVAWGTLGAALGGNTILRCGPSALHVVGRRWQLRVGDDLVRREAAVVPLLRRLRGPVRVGVDARGVWLGGDDLAVHLLGHHVSVADAPAIDHALPRGALASLPLPQRRLVSAVLNAMRGERRFREAADEFWFAAGVLRIQVSRS